jgi:hypothetical protein
LVAFCAGKQAWLGKMQMSTTGRLCDMCEGRGKC